MSADELNIAMEISALRKTIEKIQRAKPPKWEYNFVPLFSGESDNIACFNEMGNDGWELLFVKVGIDKGIAIFKREVT